MAGYQTDINISDSNEGENRPWVERERGKEAMGGKKIKGNVYTDRLSPDRYLRWSLKIAQCDTAHKDHAVTCEQL